ncbi:hypothetical protein EJ02DRAFT_452972 [Clathrospora elynae]|uniref:Secreted protein n=1 Tax=Clathrospora elynae TaxID=706981 RepID=A0A6A5SU54_9PLEO|nr:hypothetical protein EJ02DRAFT_452972 [Clathrospora elynae]
MSPSTGFMCLAVSLICAVSLVANTGIPLLDRWFTRCATVTPTRSSSPSLSAPSRRNRGFPAVRVTCLLSLNSTPDSGPTHVDSTRCFHRSIQRVA